MSEHVYPSKIDRWLSILFTFSAAASVAACVAALSTGEPAAWLLVVFILLVAVGLPWWLIHATAYTVTDATLLIRSGPFRWCIALLDIHSIEATTNPLSSPALSLDRLRIDYGKNSSIMISPEDRAGFLADLANRGVQATSAL